METRIRQEEEEKVIEAALAIISEALQDANQSLQDSCKRLDELQLQLNREKPSESDRELSERREANPAGNRKHQAA
jgi:hypothetical protein